MRWCSSVPDSVVNAMSWVWPPALVVLVVWVWIRAKREMRSRARVWLLNPVLVLLLLFALGGGYARLSQSTAPAVAMRGQLSTWGRTGSTWSATARAARP